MGHSAAMPATICASTCLNLVRACTHFLGKASLGGRDLRRAASPSTLNWFAQAFTIFHAADSACLMSPSFEVTATTMFLAGMNTTSAYHIVFDPLCQYTV